MTSVAEDKTCPPSSPGYEESLSSSLESLELRTHQKMSAESDESGIATSISSASTMAKPFPKSMAASIAARHKFEKVWS